MAEPTHYQKLVAAAKRNITEIAPMEAATEIKRNAAVLIDVREDDEWSEAHAKNAIHLSRGMLEVEIEEKIPDMKQPIICYCGGGGRSALAAESLQKMGYENVRSMAGGFKAWREADLPAE
jgi:rhodanese-related sulfurtransferase